MSPVAPRPEGSQMSPPLSRHSSCVVKVAPSPRGEPDVTPTLTTQQLRRESVKVKILLCRPSRHSSCVVKVCPASLLKIIRNTLKQRISLQRISEKLPWQRLRTILRREAGHTFTTQLLCREGLQRKIFTFRLSRRSCCVVKVCRARFSLSHSHDAAAVS